jgi:hypothetical protein
MIAVKRETGLEPATSSLGSWHSTTELLPQIFNPAVKNGRNLPQPPKSRNSAWKDFPAADLTDLSKLRQLK